MIDRLVPRAGFAAPTDEPAGAPDTIFPSRRKAGEELAKKLAHYADDSDVLVLALPRGGVPVGYEVARALHAPLDVFMARKLGVPGDEELAMGAIAGAVRVIDDDIVRAARLSDEAIEGMVRREQQELARREQLYRGGRPSPIIRGRKIILVDDGLATGSTMRAAALALRQMRPARIVVAVPVGAHETCQEFRGEVDEVVCAATPEPFTAVGAWYTDFSQTSDAEVRTLLRQAGREYVSSVYGKSGEETPWKS